jgi:hypothetical protein
MVKQIFTCREGDIFSICSTRVDQLQKMHDKIAEFADAFDLDQGTNSSLELACEEVFVHMVDESQKKNITRDIFFRLRNEKNAVSVDVRCGTRVQDVSLDSENSMLPRNLDVLKEEELKFLGLMLLGLIAENIEHIHINNLAFISFEIPRKNSP